VLFLIFAVIVLAGVSSFLAYERFGDSVLTGWLENRDSELAEPNRRVEKSKAQAEAKAPDVVDVVEKPADEASAEANVAADLEPGEANESTAAVADASAKVAADDGADSAGAQPANPPEKQTQPAKLVFEPPNPADSGPTMAPAPNKRRRARAQPVEETPDEGSLSAAEQRIIDDFDSGADAAPAKIAVKESAGSQSVKPPLDGDGVRATVTTNKPRLQRCYERAIRGQQAPQSVRLDVSVTVAASGRVQEVSADGNGPGGLAECIEASVRRWRFPASSEGGPAKFPIVFSAN
jgi:hypothetical protein